jgi:hypothetical protein
MRILKSVHWVMLVVVAMAASSCSSTEIGQLEGQWELFYINHLDDPNIYIWEFASGGEFVVRSYPLPTEEDPDPPVGVLGTGKYETSAEFLDAVVVISEVVTTSSHLHTQMSSCCMGENSAAWTILEIDNEVLRLGTADAGGYVIREFTRVK